MRFVILILASLVHLTAPVLAEDEEGPALLRQALEGALRGCEAWVLEPASWSDGVEPFLAVIGLTEHVRETFSLPDAFLPPPSLRRANRYWRIDAGQENGYALVVSEGIPMCHIAGGGGEDLQPVAEIVITAANFRSRWDKVSEERTNDMVSTLFRSRDDKAFTLLFSRAATPDARRDRPQVVVTGFYSLTP